MSGYRRLDEFMSAVRWARYRQLIVEQLWIGLFVGLSLAAVALFTVRYLFLPVSPWFAATSCVGASVAIALLAVWWLRPDDVSLAVSADIHLKLKQKLSTAWEIAQLHPDHPMAERLTRQALNARLPPRVQHIFPLTLTTWGKLLPVALGIAVLAAVIEVRQVDADVRLPIADELVIHEGERLREFGQYMERRAERDALSVSAQRAREIRRLGGQMATGAMPRTACWRFVVA